MVGRGISAHHGHHGQILCSFRPPIALGMYLQVLGDASWKNNDTKKYRCVYPSSAAAFTVSKSLLVNISRPY